MKMKKKAAMCIWRTYIARAWRKKKRNINNNIREIEENGNNSNVCDSVNFMPLMFYGLKISCVLIEFTVDYRHATAEWATSVCGSYRSFNSLIHSIPSVSIRQKSSFIIFLIRSKNLIPRTKCEHKKALQVSKLERRKSRIHME